MISMCLIIHDSKAARSALLKNSSQSGFIARQVASYVDRFKALTVPELREEASRKKLNKSGKRNQLLVRLSIWARDEIAKVSPASDESGEVPSEILPDKAASSDCSDGDQDDDSTTSSDELELFGDDEHIQEDHEKFGRKDTQWRATESKGENEAAARGDTRICEPDQESVENSVTPSVSSGEIIAGRQIKKALRSIFGHENFREGQEWAIRRCLDHKRTLLIAPTGFG